MFVPLYLRVCTGVFRNIWGPKKPQLRDIVLALCEALSLALGKIILHLLELER